MKGNLIYSGAGKSVPVPAGVNYPAKVHAAALHGVGF